MKRTLKAVALATSLAVLSATFASAEPSAPPDETVAEIGGAESPANGEKKAKKKKEKKAKKEKKSKGRKDDSEQEAAETGAASDSSPAAEENVAAESSAEENGAEKNGGKKSKKAKKEKKEKKGKAKKEKAEQEAPAVTPPAGEESAEEKAEQEAPVEETAQTEGGEAQENAPDAKEETPPKKKKEKKKREKKPKGKKAKFEYALDKAFAEGDYAKCISMLQTQGSGRGEILDALNLNMLMYLTGSYLDSAKAFMDTQSAMQQTTADMSGGKAFAAAIAGENSVTYAGNVYERLLSYSMRALNAFALGDVGNAKGVMDAYTGDYKDVIAPLVAMEKELEAEGESSLDGSEMSNALEQMSSLGVNLNVSDVVSGLPQKSSRTYDTSAFLSYLGTLAYAANGDTAHARDFAQVLNTANPAVNVREDISIPAGMGRLNVIALSGTIGRREQNDAKLMPIGAISKTGTMIFLKIVYPVFNEQVHAIQSVRVTLSNGTARDAVIVEDFDEAVRIDVERKARGAFCRSVFRNIVKNAAAAAGGIAAIKAAENAMDDGNTFAAVGLLAAKIGLNGALAAIVDAERADVRQGRFFPNKASAAGFTLAPGTYSAKVEYLSADGSVVETKEIGDIAVEAGKPTVVVSSCEK